MTPEDIASVRRTLAAIDADRVTVAAEFYRRLFEAHPDVRALFADDLTAQEQKFADEMAEVGRLLDHVDELRAHTADLGERHRGYGVRAAHYAAVRDVLVATLADRFGDEFTADDERAWRRMVNLVAQAMQLPPAPLPR